MREELRSSLTLIVTTFQQGEARGGVGPFGNHNSPFPLSRGRVHPEGFSLKGIQGIGLLIFKRRGGRDRSQAGFYPLIQAGCSKPD